MATSLVLTVMSPDQPGLVEILSQTIADHGGSWEQSRMARLAGFFVGILEVRVPAASAVQLAEGLEALGSRGIRIQIEDSPVVNEAGKDRELRLELVGQDRPGIIRDISAALVAVGANVVDLETECISAAMSGETLFRAAALIHHPVSLSVDVLRETLEKLADELMVDISVDEAAEGSPGPSGKSSSPPN